MAFALFTYFIISLQYTQSTVLENATEYTSQLIGQVNNDIDSYISYMENISFIVANNSDVRDYLFTENLTWERSEQLQERIVTLFQTVSDTREAVSYTHLDVYKRQGYARREEISSAHRRNFSGSGCGN